MRKIRLLSLVLALLMCMSVFAACNKPAAIQELSVCVGSEPDSSDPAYNEAVDGATLLIHAFSGICKLDKDGMPQPDAAKEIKISEDGLTYTITLRDGLKWSDGKDLVAEDFIYAWKRAIDPVNATSYGYMLENITGVADVYYADPEVDVYDVDAIGAKAIDAKTIEITLPSAAPYFMEILAFPPLFPVRKDIVESDEAWSTKPETYITNGPYKMKAWDHDAQIVFEKNEYYHDKDAILPETIKFVLMDDDNAILAAYQNGTIMLADSVPNDEIDNLRDNDEFFIAGQLGTYFVCFNTEKEPFDDMRVRKALSLVIDRNFIVEQIGKAGQEPATAYVATGLTDGDPTKEFRDVGGDYYSVAKEDYQANCDEARQLLADAGYANGEGFPKFEYLLNTSTGHKLIAEALQNMWKTELGIDCTIAEQEWGVFLNTRQNGEYEVARHGWLADYNDPISFLDMWVTGGGNNDAQWSNAEYDALISGVKTSSDRTKRYADMHAAEDILMEEMPVSPIYYYVDIYMKSAKLEGFYSSPLGYKYFMYCSVTD
ncbi:MAG: peptide ABC transporter substrate-binding protein [Clostridiaceae bacterium]|nr:peptide ABC transporter substrate-binding protein [Clostridiaceae bacterium]